jgi:CheY-like chemotaxis protein
MSKVSRRHILVVDDNPGVRETLAMLLMCAGYDVAVAEDGFAGLSELSKTMPDVLISDLEMPRCRVLSCCLLCADVSRRY